MALNAVAGVVRIDLVSRDPDALARFYVDAFGFVKRASPAKADEEKRIALRLGDQEIALARPALLGRPYPAEVPGWSLAFQHFAIVVGDMRAAMARLAELSGWSAISTGGPQLLPASSGGVTAFKFRDPEGHPLEFLSFPPHAVPDRWSGAPASQIFLGVDHSAISVAETAASLAFYEKLGFGPSGASLNHGAEQERLDGLARAVVEVTSLSTALRPTPHLELLCYRGDYARSQEPLAPNDVAATRLVIAVGGTPDEPGRLIRDPDGHWLALEPAERRD